jgi:hypothetical protein
MLAEITQDGDSEHSALLSPALPRSGAHYVEFLLENTGTPECYIQIGVCTGEHDILGGTPAYQSSSGWCFSCHNGMYTDICACVRVCVCVCVQRIWLDKE